MIQDDYGNLVVPPSAIGINQRLDHGDARMGRIEGDVSDVRVDLAAVRENLAANTTATQELSKNTAEIVEFFQAMQGLFKVLNWLGAVAKPIGYIVALCTATLALYAAFKGHKIK